RGAATDASAAVDERIEHDAEELGHELERALLRAGGDLAREPRQRIGEIAAGQAEYARAARRQSDTAVEEMVDRPRDVLLILIEGSAHAESCRREVEQHVGRRVAERR